MNGIAIASLAFEVMFFAFAICIHISDCKKEILAAINKDKP